MESASKHGKTLSMLEGAFRALFRCGWQQVGPTVGYMDLPPKNIDRTDEQSDERRLGRKD